MINKPKIILLGPLPPPYMGPAIATQILLHSKLNDKFQIIHLNTNIHKTISTLGMFNIKVILKNVGFYIKMLVLIIRFQPQLVLIPISQTTTGFLKDSIYILISRLFFRKTILQLRGSNFNTWKANSSRLIKNYISFILGITQGVIVLGKNLTYLFADYFREDKIFVIPNGVNIAIQSKEKSIQNVKLLYFGNLQPEKGIEDVLNALLKLKWTTVNYPFELDVIGSWYDERTRSNCLSILKNDKIPVIFHQAIYGEKKYQCFFNADIFIFTPREPEGHPWVIVEAMAGGLPIISTDQGAISESVLDGVNGFIVETKNSDDIAKKLKILIEDPELRQKMGKESRRLYEENYTEDKMVERLTNVFNHVLET